MVEMIELGRFNLTTVMNADTFTLGFTDNYLNEAMKYYYDNNIVISPISIILLLLSLIGSGATKQNTHNQIRSSLGLNHKWSSPFGLTNTNNISVLSNDQLVLDLYHEIYQRLTTFTPPGTDLKIKSHTRISNALLIDDSIEIMDEFKIKSKQNFDLQIFQFNRDKPDETLSEFNKWLSTSANSLIQKPINSGQLINSNFQFGSWMHPFQTFNTKVEEFHVSDAERINVPMMSSIEPILYLNSDEFMTEIVAKELKNPDYLFMAVLERPFEPTPLDRGDGNGEENKYGTKEKSFHILTSIHVLLDQMKERVVSLKLPKMRVSFNTKIKSVLKNLNIEDLFDPDKCDLSGLSNSTKLYVESAEQLSVIKLDEIGVEAASLTQFFMNGIASQTFDTNGIIEFHANRPFSCYIYSKSLKVPVLFAHILRPEPI